MRCETCLDKHTVWFNIPAVRLILGVTGGIFCFSTILDAAADSDANRDDPVIPANAELVLGLCCSLAAERPSTISSSFFLFFSLPPTTGSSIGCGNQEVETLDNFSFFKFLSQI